MDIMTLKNIYKPTAGAIVGRTPFLLFVGTWNTELKNTKDEFQTKERVIEKMKKILVNSYIKEQEKCYNSPQMIDARMVGTGELRIGKV